MLFISIPWESSVRPLRLYLDCLVGEANLTFSKTRRERDLSVEKEERRKYG